MTLVEIKADLPEWMERAIWEGDQDTLQERAGCACCCAEHTFEHCPAKLWGGCRGRETLTDEEAWARHYELYHGLSRDQFFGGAA